MSTKKWSIMFIILYSFLLFLIGGSVVVVDPYFHYHKPLNGVFYALDKKEYINDGIIKHFSYDGIITGSSTSLSFKPSEAETLFSQNFIRISYPGEGFRKISESLSSAFSCNAELRTVIWGVDTMWFIADKDYLGHDEYPDYLYDDNVLNDTYYIFNRQILSDDLFPAILKTLKGVPSNTFDNTTGYLSGSKEQVLSAYDRPAKENLAANPSETEEYFFMLEDNLQNNIISLISTHPDITFYIFFPPYSICWWDGFNQLGPEILLRRINMEQYAIEKLINMENVKLFSFFDDYELICNLNNYVDEVHYTQSVSNYILISMKNGQHQLTKDNYKQYIQNIKDFYTNYNYDQIFE